ncbi:hypothetical protein N7638_17200 [Achromobacter mucicolens]|uniref:Uncharacterized protein n=1 Tax=Achromobacter aegrifaciens TaxID=1287736 RepID=A0AAD2J4Q0_ACHAE|nr:MULTISPECIES: hypothetical protein [Achromobacter]MDG9969781.1 hypothetical protein [Achromobacter mucicolens]CAB3893411.1 hypothetical protein LMG26684_04217 [Achromobacter mucicolens]CUJ71204.1 Uncharacterised protein [Achromobacter aegrifaciens]
MQAAINQLRRIRTLQEDPEASTNGQVLEALLDVADSFPEIIAALEGAGHNLAAVTLLLQQEEARDIISELSAALDNVLLHHGEAMPPADAVARRQLVERAEALLSR